MLARLMKYYLVWQAFKQLRRAVAGTGSAPRLRRLRYCVGDKIYSEKTVQLMSIT